MFLRMVAAAGCFTAAVLAVTHSVVDVQNLADLAAAHPEQNIAWLTQAHTVHPRDTAISIELGLELERAGDSLRAEQVLLDAARFDRQYQPAWTLANFYFRSDKQNQFWLWAARAAAMNTTDLRPLLRLAQVWAPEPGLLVARLGDRPELLRPYLDILLGEARLEAAREVAALLRAHHDPTDMARLNAPSLRNIPSARKR